MAASEHDGDSGYDGSNTTGFVSPAADALEGPIDLAAMLDLRRPHRYPVRVLGEALVDRGIYPGDVLIADTATVPTHGRVAIVNRTIIPMLCAKAGLPLRDSMGPITSHRGRASAVTALASVPQGMTLPELMAWCGHRNPKSTMRYIRVRPTQLAGAFAKADPMAHMVRVLIDQEAVLSGAARDGTPWKFYDLGHPYCTNAFWSTCPHRMACVGCSFSLPKTSAKAAAIEARASVTRPLEEVPLSPDERAAAEGDIAALDGMLAKLREVPALDGKTPHEIDSDHDRPT